VTVLEIVLIGIAFVLATLLLVGWGWHRSGENLRVQHVSHLWKLLEWQKSHAAEILSEHNHLVNRVAEMRRDGFVSPPEGEGDVFVMNDEYELDVEAARKDRAAKEDFTDFKL
jgi:hypothetical protein